ncbi:hypothetical protein PB2503_01047 [Parvularcula bermudensis HTCC2503]|uniref:Uncharacterized protein n=1 Tax=Parvularcula bermudensis (strain ATCC BAA-594 / HTCC2503 / KCTC 12087) TaxID=314260 RepID=E0TB86_PARBH|nr:M23 family metallopeptidase [Parvularcula bermudensis]ADM08290.1 hypothetical protein PB2503_01047 [Parvularcula bermudensis HTCC2503]
MGRKIGRFFRERQIYHRSEGVVRFIKLSARTQIAMATILGTALLWVAYASVNVVFKEQIIVAKDQERRDQEAAYRRRLQTAEGAYEEIQALNYAYEREFDAAITGLTREYEALRSLVENKAAVDRRFQALAENLSAAGAPGGTRRQSTNRLMIDPVGREPTPRQSRISALREEALNSVQGNRVAAGIDDAVLQRVRQDSAALSARQVVLMASLEEDMRRAIRERQRILGHTGVDLSPMVSSVRQSTADAQYSAVAPAPTDDGSFIGQGGPFIPADLGSDASPTDPTAYFRSAARVHDTFTELVTLNEALSAVPLSQPLKVPHRMTSRFGIRWDPMRRNVRAAHKGLDFAAPRNSPLLATAPGKVTFAGWRSGFGRTVEIDHGNGFKTRFAHMNRIKVKAGDVVELHDVVGLMGSTGRSTGTHLHYEIHYRGRQVDPLKFIEAGRYVFES